MSGICGSGLEKRQGENETDQHCLDHELTKQSDDILAPLETQRAEMVGTWQEFNHLFETESDSAQLPGRVPTIETLYKAIDQAQGAWLAKKAKGWGRAKERFLEFSNTMDDHSYLFSVIPSGDKYISLITGVVSSVVKV